MGVNWLWSKSMCYQKQISWNTYLANHWNNIQQCHRVIQRFQPSCFGGNLPFSVNISSLPCLLSILPVFETLPLFHLTSLFSMLFCHFSVVLSHFYPFGIRPWVCGNFGSSISINCDLKMQGMASEKYIPPFFLVDRVGIYDNIIL